MEVKRRKIYIYVNCVLILIFLTADSSEASKTTDNVLSQRDVVEAMDSGRFVAIRLENGTEDTKQFSQICILLYMNEGY